MSTILKALRRLEEDRPGKAKSSNVEADANAEVLSPASATAAGSDAVGQVADSAAAVTEQADSAAPAATARPPEARPTARRAPTDPRATDELRERILAEERASEAVRVDRARAGSRERAEAIAAPASASLAGTLTPAPDPFANRVVEPAFTPPSSATPGHKAPGMDSASPSNASAGSSGVLSRGLMVAALGLGFVGVFAAGFFYSGQSGTTAAVESTPAANEIVSSAAAPLDAEPTRAAVQVASASIPSTEAPAAPVRPMTATHSAVAPRPGAPLQAAAPKPRPTPRAVPAAEPAQAEPSNALARAAVTPTRAARETIREAAREAPADSVVASRPRAQNFPADRARVSAAAPAETSPPAEPTRVAATVPKTSAKELPMAEIAPSRSVRALPEATSSTSASAPAVALIESRGLPDLTVIRTSWHPTAGRRSAKIRLEEKNELVTLREGDTVGGMVIHEISPSAVLFSAGEVQIRRRVGEASFGR